MKHLLFVFVICTSFYVQAQDPEVYFLDVRIFDDENSIAFVSLSDNYPLSQEPDSLPIPRPRQQPEETPEYIELEGEFRQRFLSGTKVRETDNVFIYDYEKDILVTLKVSGLQTIALLSSYVGSDRYYFEPEIYMYGFRIERLLVKNLGRDFDNCLVAVGSINPFEKGGMKPVVWKQTAALKELPLKEIDDFLGFDFEVVFTAGNAYEYLSGNLRYFVQEINSDEVSARQLIISDINSGNTITSRLFISDESSGPAALNGVGSYDKDYGDYIWQWQGKLFTNKPPVIFGLEFTAYSCPSIIVAENSDEDIYINCDNRY